MTSSLVGSEMCIRDSRSPVVLSSTKAPVCDLFNREQRGIRFLAMVERAVSYTHLTLPTICSV
eukprot:454629-Prorocentrum_lima.AAC.1